MSKQLAIYVRQNPCKVGNALQSLAFGYGFFWKKSGLPAKISMPENPYYIVFDLESQTIDFLPFFDTPNGMKVFELKTEFVDGLFDEHPTIAILKKVLSAHGKDMSAEMEKRTAKIQPKLEPNVRSPVAVMRKGDRNWSHDPLILMQDFVANQQKQEE